MFRWLFWKIVNATIAPYYVPIASVGARYITTALQYLRGKKTVEVDCDKLYIISGGRAIELVKSSKYEITDGVMHEMINIESDYEPREDIDNEEIEEPAPMDKQEERQVESLIDMDYQSAYKPKRGHSLYAGDEMY